MHYKNGREAKEADPIIQLDPYSKKIRVGVLHSLAPSAQTCNGQIAWAVPGGVQQISVTIGDCLHAEDAYLAVFPEALAPAS